MPSGVKQMSALIASVQTSTALSKENNSHRVRWAPTSKIANINRKKAKSQCWPSATRAILASSIFDACKT